MTTPSLTKLVAAAGGALFVLTAGAGVASAAPDISPIINTTCNYGQVVSAITAQDPGAAANFNSSPMAQSWLKGFLASPPPKREQMMAQIQAIPESQQYIGPAIEVANTCNNF